MEFGIEIAFLDQYLVYYANDTRYGRSSIKWCHFQLPRVTRNLDCKVSYYSTPNNAK